MSPVRNHARARAPGGPKGRAISNRMSTALLSSCEKDEPLLRLARLLKDHDWNLLGSAGTCSFLKENDIECLDIGDIVGPPILGHRVVSLSREIYAGLLATTEADFKELKKLRISPIDLVYVTLYPLEDAVKRNASPEEVIEKNDIGGPTILRAAAKGRRLALSNSEQIADIETWLKKGTQESDRASLALRLAAAAERRVADYVSVSARYWTDAKIARDPL